jgi:peptide/nickel transport system substrate-binding protein
MPERIAATDPFKQINEYVGSGPMRFMKDEWVPGAKASFNRRVRGQPVEPERDQ